MALFYQIFYTNDIRTYY